MTGGHRGVRSPHPLWYGLLRPELLQCYTLSSSDYSSGSGNRVGSPGRRVNCCRVGSWIIKNGSSFVSRILDRSPFPNFCRKFNSKLVLCRYFSLQCTTQNVSPVWHTRSAIIRLLLSTTVDDLFAWSWPVISRLRLLCNLRELCIYQYPVYSRTAFSDVSCSFRTCYENLYSPDKVHPVAMKTKITLN